ncbi:hypothetical protein [Bacillus solimangrovi]|uniref:Uncharacterized protein n=1 Tax=Bacillus solimangrovi TaxID=1305675 RepID=A0A1E5LJI6_9BACI|nr:hypothetical protein [Bacillus solimangrovi]OEH94244.1 hypothetical protein BFG57_09350 [Bacillus solimangrovi]
MNNKEDVNLQINKELEQFDSLNDFSVEFPSEEDMYQTIETLRQYVPNQQEKTIFNKLSDLLHLSAIEFFFIDKSFWLSNLAFFTLGLLFGMTAEVNPYVAIMVLSPIPFLVGLLEVFKGKDDNVNELISTLKYSAQQLVLARMVIIGAYNFGLSIGLISLLSFFGEGQLILTKILLYWIIPFMLVASLGLWLAQKIKGQLAAPITVLIWISFSMMYMSSETVMTYVESRPSFYYILTIILAAVFLFQQIKTIKRGVSYELNN